MLEFHREIIALHKAHPVFTGGSLQFLMGDYNCLAYGRFDAREKMVVVFNNNGEDRDLTIKVWPAEVEANQKLRRIFFTDGAGYTRNRRNTRRIRENSGSICPLLLPWC